MEEPALRTLLERAADDDTGADARVEVCRTLASTLRMTGKTMWVGGYLIGGDRPSGRSPFEFGSDATVGLATVVQVAGELIGGATELMEQENLYAGAALLRQVVEAEYLAWAFAEDEAEAAAWIRSTPEERREIWQPRHLRERSDDRFRAPDYAWHCEQGGHPTPTARGLLPGHSAPAPVGLWWFDLATHGVSIWDYVTAGAEGLGYEDLTRTTADALGLPDAIERWRSHDPLHEARSAWSQWRSVPADHTSVRRPSPTA